ncbi:hypothetical protein LJR296_007008 [Cupriavidus necator]
MVTDLGSGLNYRKKGLRLLNILCGRVSRPGPRDEDRLLRFGSELLFQICQFWGVRLSYSTQLRQFPVSSSSRVEILTVFSSRLYGSRRPEEPQSAGCLMQALPRPACV